MNRADLVKALRKDLPLCQCGNGCKARLPWPGLSGQAEASSLPEAEKGRLR
jgi:hypothetical protein